jgi:hypothetical protein
MIDLINLLACLTEKGKITLQGFYDNVRELTPSEEKFYDAITQKWYIPFTTINLFALKKHPC